MKCISCEVQIDPKWKHAIDINICPFCGKGIMEDELKNLFSSLRATMESLQAYPEQLNDWLLSNHNYIKTDSGNLKDYLPKDYKDEIKRERDLELASRRKDEALEKQERKFTVKVATEQGEEEVLAEKIQTDEKTGDFFKRADVLKPNIDGFKSTAEKTKHLKSMVQQIKRGGSPVANSSEMISPEMMDNADPEAVAEMEAILSGNESINSSLSDGGDDSDDPPAFVVAALNNKASKNNGGNNTADMIKHQKMYDRVSESKKNFNSGGGGFSRA